MSKPILKLHLARVWAALALGGAAGCAHAETLSDVVRFAVAQHPQVRVAAAQRSGAAAGVDEARAAYFPRVDLSVDGGRRRQDSRTGHGPMMTDGNATLSLTQTLYDGGARSAELARQRAREQSMGARERETRERIAMSAVEAYANLLSAREMHALARENLESHRSVVAKLETLVRIDPGRRFELSQALARQSLAEVVLTARAVRLRESGIQFERVVGRAPGTLDALAMPAVQPTREAALAEALLRNPAVAIADSEIVTSRHGLAASTAHNKPRVQFGVQGSRGHDHNGNPGRSGDQSVMLTASWNLFDGGAGRARVRQAAAELEATQATADDTRRTVRENLDIAWNNLTGHGDSNRELEEQVHYARDTLSAYHDQFRIGRRSVLDVLNAENELFTARSNLVSGQYAERIAAFQLMAVQGRLLEAVGANGRR